MALSVSLEPCLARRTTLRLGGTAVAEVRVERAEDLAGASETLSRLGGTPLVLGWGSNILARDGRLPLTLLRPELKDGPRELGREAGSARVRCGAGVRLPRLLAWAAERGLAGLEGLAGIPGTVGGAAAMNAGSYGAEFCACVASMDVWTPAGGVTTLPRDAFGYGYRSFSPRLPEGDAGPWVILSVELELAQGDAGAIRRTMRDHLQQKKRTQPITAATAGCVFKNPAGESAGRLLDQAGFRGRRLGGVGFSEMHANFLVNHGDGTSDQALELLAQAGETVRDRFGVSLELEVKVVG